MKKKAFVSGIITLISLILFVFSEPVYSFAGDGSIAKYLASNAEPGFNSISWGIGALLKIFVKLFPSINWWTIFSIFVMFASLFFITLFIQELFEGIKGIIISIVFALFMWEAAYSIDINFTQTAILSGITGTSAAVMMNFRSTIKCKVLYGIIGILFILIAGSLRFDAMLLCIPFAIVVLALRGMLLLLQNRKSDQSVSSDMVPDVNIEGKDLNAATDSPCKKMVFHIMASFIVIIVAGFVSYGSHKVYRIINPDIAFFEDTFDLTREVYDYLDMYPDYDELEDVYEAAGIKPSWYAMLTNYYIADTNYFNVETISVPVQFKGPSTKTFGGYMDEMLNYKAALILGLMVLVLSGVLTSVKKGIFSLASAIGVFIMSGLYFVHVGRYAWRVSGGVTVACVVMGLMMLAELLKVYQVDNDISDAHTTNKVVKIKNILGYIILTISVISVVADIVTTKSFAFPKAEITDEAKAGLLDYMDSNSDIIYFTEDYDYASHNIWYVGTPGYLDNKFVIFAGYNEGRKKDLQSFGINDMSQFVINMLTRDDIYTEYSNVWHSYLCDYYNPYVSAGIVDIYEPTGTQFIRYVAPVEVSEDSFNDMVSDVSLYVDSSKSVDSYQVVHIDAKTSIQDEDVEYYLNIENSSTGAIYSYPLVLDGTKLTGNAIWVNDTWSFMDTRQYIVIKYPDGVSVRTLDITGTPVPFL